MDSGRLKVLLDTHAVVFLWSGRVEQFGRRSRDLLERAVLLISPMVRLELAFLREIGRIEPEPGRVLGDLARDVGLTLADEPLDALIPHAEPLAWTRDPFDRLLVASARLHELPFVTRDRDIRENFEDAIW